MAHAEDRISSEKQQLLAGLAERGLREARPVFDWLQKALDTNSLKLVELQRSQQASMEAFFDTIAVGGRSSTVMGCLQRIRFPWTKRESPAPTVDLKKWVQTRFMPEATWTHPDGLPGGFGYFPLLRRESSDGRVVPCGPNETSSDLDLSLVGSEFDWVTLRVEIYDFVRCVPAMRPHVRTLSRFIKEAAYITACRDFMQCRFPAKEIVVEECGLGYAFLPAVVHPNPFGYGPGRFGVALKLFRFAVLKNADVEVSMIFLSVPRSTAVLHLWGLDPVYGTARLLDFFTFRRFGILKGLQDKLDRQFMTQHGVVHQSAIEGLRRTWEETRWSGRG
jgi:hypothetical protein